MLVRASSPELAPPNPFKPQSILVLIKTCSGLTSKFERYMSILDLIRGECGHFVAPSE
jgi:hypothetical protein